MTKIALTPNASGTGTFTLAAPDSDTDRTFTLPDATGEVVLNEGSGTFKIDSSGNVGIGTSIAGARLEVSAGSQVGLGVTTTGASDVLPIKANAGGSTSENVYLMAYRVGDDTLRGSIFYNGTSVAYNTSSDYRLKEDVQPMVGATSRVLALRPLNFAWKSNGTRVDGFLAHEAQAVVPEAVTGEKDGEEMQAIDQSKLVPLLTAALQEALADIATLKDEVAALKGASA